MGIKQMHVWYGHRNIPVWLLTKLPPEYEENRDILKYHQRGWPTFEMTVSGLTKTPAHVVDLGMLPWLHLDSEAEVKDSFYDVLAQCSKGKGDCVRKPPATYQKFEEELTLKRFTNGHDKAMVLEKYQMVINAIFAASRKLNFRHLSWKLEEAEMLSHALPEYKKLEWLDLSYNNIGHKGTEYLARVLPRCKNLVTVFLEKCRIQDSGVQSLAQVMPQCGQLKRLNLRRNEFGDEGATCLADALGACGTFEWADLDHNKIADDGAVRLSVGIQSCWSLQVLTLEGNDIGVRGKMSLTNAAEERLSHGPFRLDLGIPTV